MTTTTLLLTFLTLNVSAAKAGPALADLRGTGDMEPLEISLPAPAPVPQEAKNAPVHASFTLRVGDKVITDGGHTGRVAGISDDGKISVRNDDGSYDLWKPGQVAKRQGCSLGVCVGNNIITQFGLGKVAGVYANGRLAVRDNDPRMGYTTCTGEKDIARTKGCSGGFCVGDTVVPDAVPGKVAGIFPDGRLSVRIDELIYHIHDPKQFAQTGGCSSGYCVGERVIAENGNTYTVAAIFPNGRLSIFSGEYYYESGGEDLAKTKGCSGRICVGERVITTHRYSGRIMGVFPDGTVSLRRDDYGEDFAYYRWDTRLLAKTEGCSGGFCTGSKLVTKDGAGTVAGIFDKGDGEFSVRIAGEYYNTRPDQVAKPGTCSSGFCAGDKVINTGTGHTGIVEGTFADGGLSVKVEGPHFFSRDLHYVCAAEDLVKAAPGREEPSEKL